MGALLRRAAGPDRGVPDRAWRYRPSERPFSNVAHIARVHRRRRGPCSLRSPPFSPPAMNAPARRARRRRTALEPLFRHRAGAVGTHRPAPAVPPSAAVPPLVSFVSRQPCNMAGGRAQRSTGVGRRSLGARVEFSRNGRVL